MIRFFIIFYFSNNIDKNFIGRLFIIFIFLYCWIIIFRVFFFLYFIVGFGGICGDEKIDRLWYLEYE